MKIYFIKQTNIPTLYDFIRKVLSVYHKDKYLLWGHPEDWSDLECKIDDKISWSSKVKLHHMLLLISVISVITIKI